MPLGTDSGGDAEARLEHLRRHDLARRGDPHAHDDVRQRLAVPRAQRRVDALGEQAASDLQRVRPQRERRARRGRRSRRCLERCTSPPLPGETRLKLPNFHMEYLQHY